MGAACCVAARDKAIVNGSGNELLHRNTRCSSTWSFRWDNRGRVAGEDTSISWFSDAISRDDGSEVKYESASVSEDGSVSESFQSRTWKESPTSEGTGGQLRTPDSGEGVNRIPSILISVSS